MLLAVNFQKGCYPGQELVERMDTRGADAPRSLRIVDLAHGAAVGDAVHDADGNEVGVVTSVTGDGGIGLAYVKRGADVGRRTSATSPDPTLRRPVGIAADRDADRHDPPRF